jgi:hypothetical protein
VDVPGEWHWELGWELENILWIACFSWSVACLLKMIEDLLRLGVWPQSLTTILEDIFDVRGFTMGGMATND